MDPKDPNRRFEISSDTPYEDLLVPIYKEGILIYQSPDLADIKRRATSQLGYTNKEEKRILNPEPYKAYFEKSFYDLKMAMIQDLRGVKNLYKSNKECTQKNVHK